MNQDSLAELVCATLVSQRQGPKQAEIRSVEAELVQLGARRDPFIEQRTDLDRGIVRAQSDISSLEGSDTSPKPKLSKQEQEQLQSAKAYALEKQGEIKQCNDSIATIEKDIKAKESELDALIGDLARLEDEAKLEGRRLVPPSLSVASLGITGSFFIELTAILTIIFGIVILGIVGVLGTREIATILAAISGYVLGSGKAAARSGPEPQPAPPPAAQG